MGQYHLTVNLDKREYLHPHRLGDGLKLWEQINSEGGVMAALMLLLACSNGRGGGDVEQHPLVGSWAGDRIAVVGDYAVRDDLGPNDDADLIYGLCGTEADRQAQVTHYRELAERARIEDPLYRLSAEEWEAKARRCEQASIYQDISHKIRPLVEQVCGVSIEKQG